MPGTAAVGESDADPGGRRRERFDFPRRRHHYGRQGTDPRRQGRADGPVLDDMAKRPVAHRAMVVVDLDRREALPTTMSRIGSAGAAIPAHAPICVQEPHAALGHGGDPTVVGRREKARDRHPLDHQNAATDGPQGSRERETAHATAQNDHLEVVAACSSSSRVHPAASLPNECAFARDLGTRDVKLVRSDALPWSPDDGMALAELSLRLGMFGTASSRYARPPADSVVS